LSEYYYDDGKQGNICSVFDYHLENPLTTVCGFFELSLILKMHLFLDAPPFNYELIALDKILLDSGLQVFRPIKERNGVFDDLASLLPPLPGIATNAPHIFIKQSSIEPLSTKAGVFQIDAHQAVIHQDNLFMVRYQALPHCQPRPAAQGYECCAQESKVQKSS
jgi:hypothetical protein